MNSINPFAVIVGVIFGFFLIVLANFFISSYTIEQIDSSGKVIQSYDARFVRFAERNSTVTFHDIKTGKTITLSEPYRATKN